MLKLAKTSVYINDLLAKRWSPRAFELSKKVEDSNLLSLCEAARWAPSCGGDEPWRFVVVNYYDDVDSYNKVFETLDEGNQKWCKNVPVFICGFADKKWRQNRSKENEWALFDVGAAAMSIYLQAFDLGLYAHPMAGFNRELLRENLNVPEDFIPIVVIAIGYPGNIDYLDEHNRERELKERRRLPLEVNFFKNFWGNPII
ncbi:MAG: nitroreductase family protein [Ignavibacteria bacterium]|nr:nitroreductase family protein [Ignavibacteria bacterium]